MWRTVKKLASHQQHHQTPACMEDRGWFALLDNDFYKYQLEVLEASPLKPEHTQTVRVLAPIR